MKKIVLITVILVVVPLLGSNFQKYILKPKHYEQEDKEFLNVYNEILAIVEKKDYKAIHNYLSKEHYSMFSFSNKDFNKYWKLDKRSYRKSEIWKILNDSLMKGCARNEDFIYCPYYFNNFPDDLDSEKVGIIDGNKVNIRSKPSLRSKILTNRSYEVVEIDFSRGSEEEVINNEKYSWIPIITHDGLKGYVYGKYFSNAMGCRVGFVKEEGLWKIKFITCGD